MPRTRTMFSITATIEPRYLVSVVSTWLRAIAMLISPMTRPISQRPTIQNAIAARILMPSSTTVVLRNTWIACQSMALVLSCDRGAHRRSTAPGCGVGPWSNTAPLPRPLPGWCRWCTTAALAAWACGGAPVGAVEPEGYVRVGSGDFGARNRTCYNLGISGGHYRLGNECDFYGEFGLSHGAEADGVRWRGLGMVNYQRPASDGSASNGGVEQLYVEGHGFAFAPEVALWLGQRFYGRADVHILDTQFVRMDGAGLGAHGIALGAARLGVAYFRLDAGSGVPLGVQTSDRPARRVNLDLSDI